MNVIRKYITGQWTENINGEPYTPKGVSTVRGRVLGVPAVVILKGAGSLAYIVSTLIRHNGDRMDSHSIFRDRTWRITRELEDQFSLTRFYDPDILPAQKISQELSHKVVYGQPHRKETVERILDHVINQYKFTSLDELNAVLRLYNVKAAIVRDKQESNKVRGLMYHTLDENGHKIGLSFKSSSFESQPTLKNLEQKFALNQSLQRQQLERLTMSIDWAFAGRSVEWEVFRKNLLKEKIHVVPERNEKGDLKNIYYVDTFTRCVFDGASIGGRYNSQSIQARCISEEQIRLEQSLKQQNKLKLKNYL